MIFTKIRLTAGTIVIDLPVQGALPTDPFQLRGLDGFVSPGKDVFISKNMEKGYYSGSAPLTLQPVITVGLNPNWATGQTVSDLRTILYSMLTLDSEPTLIQIMNGATEICRCNGYLSKPETSPFSKDPVVQLTFESDDSYLRAPAPVVLGVGTGLSATNNTQATFTNVGSAKSGMIAKATINVASGSGVAFQTVGGLMIVSDPILAGDVITVNTIYGQRDILRTRSGSTVSLIGALSTLSPDWLKVNPGANGVLFSTPALGPLNYNWISLQYTPQYWGI